MDTAQTRRQAIAQIILSLDEVADMLEVTAGAPRLLSLDIFDTILTRACGRPSDLFVWLGRRLATSGKIKCAPEVFAQARASAELAVWIREGGLDSKAGLSDFYVEVASRLHLDEALVPELVDAELALEATVLRTVPSAQRLLRRCQELGLPVAFASDTYFSAEFVKSQLSEKGLLLPGSLCLVSSELSESKASGRLFEKLLVHENAPQVILHVGDHPHSDVAAPNRIGLDTRWCVAARLSRYEERLADATRVTAGLATSLAGASRMTRLTTEAADGREAAIRDVASGVAGPVLTGYVLWILKRAQELSLERLVFLARDGQVLAEMARRIAATLELSIEIRYLFVSRQSTNLAATFDANEEEIGWVFRDVQQLSISEFLQRFDLKWEDVTKFFEELEGRSATSPAQEISSLFREQLADGHLREIVLERANARRRIVVDYLKQEGLLDGVAQGIVDFGGVGSQIRAIYTLTKNAGATPPRIFMIGLDKPEDAGLTTPLRDPDWIKQTECYLYDHRRKRGIKRARGFGTCVQMFCAADHGTVTGYRYEGDVVVPTLAMSVDEPLIDWGLRLYRASLANFVDHLLLDEDLVDPYADVRDVTCDLIRMFWTQPEPNEAAAWGSFPFEGAQASGGGARPLVRRYTIRSIGSEIAAGKFPDLGWQHWYEGSLAVSAPAIRALLKRAEATYRQLESGQSVLHSGLAAGIRKLAGR